MRASTSCQPFESVTTVSDMSGGLSSEFETVVTLSNGWQDVLARNQVAWVIMPTGSPLVRLLSADPQWEGVYSDGTAAILRKK